MGRLYSEMVRRLMLSQPWVGAGAVGAGGRGSDITPEWPCLTTPLGIGVASYLVRWGRRHPALAELSPLPRARQ